MPRQPKPAPAPQPPTMQPDWLSDILRDVPPILSVQDLATLVRMSEKQIRRMVVLGRITPLKSDGEAHGNGRVLFSRVEVSRYLASMVAR